MVHTFTGYHCFVILRCQVWGYNVITGALQGLPCKSQKFSLPWWPIAVCSFEWAQNTPCLLNWHNGCDLSIHLQWASHEYGFVKLQAFWRASLQSLVAWEEKGWNSHFGKSEGARFWKGIRIYYNKSCKTKPCKI